MLNSADVKDKNIKVENYKFRAQVEYYDGRSVDCGLFDSLHGAQVELAKYPRDVWDGYDFDHYLYRGLDHEFRKAYRRAHRATTERPHSPQTVRPVEFGRSFGGFV